MPNRCQIALKPLFLGISIISPILFFIDFDGVYRNSEVWINGHYLGIRPYGYISFRYDITPYLYLKCFVIITPQIFHTIFQAIFLYLNYYDRLAIRLQLIGINR